MVGAIDFLRQYRDLCNEPKSCVDCPVFAKKCLLDSIYDWTDEDITEFVRTVTTIMERKKSND